MELSEKIQKLRKEQGLTQEQLARRLFVSRTAVSKWETGRGTPELASLQRMAELFCVTLEQLLSHEEIVVLAQSENKEKLRAFALRMTGVMDLSTLFFQLLPLYKAERDGIFFSVPLYRLGGWQAGVFWVMSVILALCGLAQLCVAGCEKEKAAKGIGAVAAAVHIGAILLLILCGHPYPAVLFVFLFSMKAALWQKKNG